MNKANKPEEIDIGTLPTGGNIPEANLDLKTGIEIIKEHHKTLPNSPGVYRMIGADGAVLYVGKAKSLKKRVATYARGAAHTNQLTRVLAMVRSMEFTITHTESEALLLEANLIRRLKPRYNVLMRDDKSFPYIAIGLNHPSPYLAKHRGPREKGVEYFGPFASGQAVNDSITILQKAFMLRTCSDAEFENRSRPCMLYQIKRCAAPCVNLTNQLDYRELVDGARMFLRGKSSALQDELAEQMNNAAQVYDYEKAAILRDRIRALASIRTNQSIYPQTFANADIFAIHSQGGMTIIEVAFFRATQHWGNRAYFPKHDKSLSTQEVLDSFIGQFYQSNPPPDLIIMNEPPLQKQLMEDALSMLAGSKVRISVPKQGDKKDILEQVIKNAQITLSRRLSETGAIGKILDEVQKQFNLETRPERIEVYDNSHIQGTNAVGAMIVAGPEGFMKNQYRKWTIKNAKGGDDFAMMREVFTRRFNRIKEDLNDYESRPDLIIIDGGQIQLAAVLDVARELEVDKMFKIVAMSKGVDRNAGREEFHEVGKAPYRLELNSPVLYYLQRLRDESHRFVIGAHRQKRGKEFVKNPLDEIEGIGPLRKKSLMSRFGSAKGVAGASVKELAETPHISEEIAKRIHAHFQSE